MKLYHAHVRVILCQTHFFMKKTRNIAKKYIVFVSPAQQSKSCAFSYITKLNDPCILEKIKVLVVWMYVTSVTGHFG